MKIINTHRRILHQSQDKVSELLRTLSTKEDMIWPHEKWPAIRFDDGLRVGSKGGHGMIRYTIIDYQPDHFIKFQFTKPIGFNGTHEFVVNGLSHDETEIIHNLIMTTSGSATIFWSMAIKYLHDALIEDAFDKMETHFSSRKNKTTHSSWIRFLRYVLKPKKKIK